MYLCLCVHAEKQSNIENVNECMVLFTFVGSCCYWNPAILGACRLSFTTHQLPSWFPRTPSFSSSNRVCHRLPHLSHTFIHTCVCSYGFMLHVLYNIFQFCAVNVFTKTVSLLCFTLFLIFWLCSCETEYSEWGKFKSKSIINSV